MHHIPRMAATTLAVLALGVLATSALAADRAQLAERLTRARDVYQELVSAPDRGVPEELQERCKCVAVFPRVIKVALGFGGRKGDGVVTCRNAQGEWSPVAFLDLAGGSWGLQLGAESGDVVLYFMTERGAQSLLESKFTLGGQVSVAAGPAGRSAEASTDLKLNAEIYSYARSKGLFAGLSLEGARIAPDNNDLTAYYGAPVSSKDLLFLHKAPRRGSEMDAFLGVLPPASPNPTSSSRVTP